ncbi:alpha/beta fold hydrolase [Kitasatospora sp. NPDC058201]|uniref:alpha/beta fold hydrolase n=1 Tax=unclassified Kitasatospora TaxID=2633591 RepID=UPI0036576226
MRGHLIENDSLVVDLLLHPILKGCADHRLGAGAPVLCVPGFADAAESWFALAEALKDRHCVAVLDLPGFGAAPRLEAGVTVEDFAGRTAAVVRRGWSGPVTLIGHSLGSVLAVRAAQKLNGQCAAVVSIEGNLTPQDGYFSGQAARHDVPGAFKDDFSGQVRRLVEDGRAPASYARSVAVADSYSMWALGRDADRCGAADGFGQEFAALRCPADYLWSRTATPPATRQYLAKSRPTHHQLTIEHHWPWTISPDAVADLVHAAAAPS